MITKSQFKKHINHRPFLHLSSRIRPKNSSGFIRGRFLLKFFTIIYIKVTMENKVIIKEKRIKIWEGGIVYWQP